MCCKQNTRVSSLLPGSIKVRIYNIKAYEVLVHWCIDIQLRRPTNLSKWVTSQNVSHAIEHCLEFDPHKQKVKHDHQNVSHLPISESYNHIWVLQLPQEFTFGLQWISNEQHNHAFVLHYCHLLEPLAKEPPVIWLDGAFALPIQFL